MAKTVLVGVTGCVAIFKTCEIVRLLQKADYRVKVVMTEHATKFIDPTMFRSLTREPVAVGLFDDAPGDPIHHISLAKEADLFLIAPCTANVMAKMACGIADDLLTTTALAMEAPIIVAPAMNVNMYEHAATRENMETLKRRGVRIIDSAEGYLACGDTGKGRLAEPEDIVAVVREVLEGTKDLQGLNVLVTAGPTHEPIDPVRFISNPSSGKMGFALAEAALERGAEVTLVTGPVGLADIAGVNMVRVTTAREMFQAVEEAFDRSDISVFTAAVSDYRPETCWPRKLKKGEDDAALENIKLVRNPDILAEMGHHAREEQVVIGFAAETEDVEANALRKLESKRADIIVANRVGKGLGFGTDDNEAGLVSRDGVTWLDRMSKRELADAILDAALKCKG